MKSIRKAGLKLNKAKCGFGVGEITFLGHHISGEGVKVDPSKAFAIFLTCLFQKTRKNFRVFWVS